MGWSNAPGKLDERLMPDPRDGKCGKMPHYCPGGGGWALLELTDALHGGTLVPARKYYTGSISVLTQKSIRGNVIMIFKTSQVWCSQVVSALPPWLHANQFHNSRQNSAFI